MTLKKKYFENIFGKGQNAGNQHIVLVHFFSKASFLESLSLSQTIQGFHDPEKEAFWKHCGKRKNWWLPAFLSFSHNVFFILLMNFSHNVFFILLMNKSHFPSKMNSTFFVPIVPTCDPRGEAILTQSASYE